MLKSELILPRLKKHGHNVTPLALPKDYHYLKIAKELIQIVKAHVGRSRGELDEKLRAYEGESLDYRIIRGLTNVLLSRCVFRHDPPINPVELRATLFNQGAVTSKSDLLTATKTRQQVIAETASKLKLTPEQIEQAMFADLLEERILLGTGEIMTPVDLIARYNLEVARGVLYWAREIEIVVRDGYKDLFKYIKLFKLMHTVHPIPGGYNIILHGPISPFVKSTIRYGLQFAKFIPALLLCKSWRMDAQVQLPETKRSLHYSLDDSTTLRSHFKASNLFDSRLEADFAAEFEKKYGGAKRKWELAREDEIIVIGDSVMIPDFSLTHRKDGRRALIEIIGFWHPQYLQRKLQKVRQAGRSDLILLLYKSANVAQSAFEEHSAGEVLSFTNKPVLKDVLTAVEKCAV